MKTQKLKRLALTALLVTSLALNVYLAVHERASTSPKDENRVSSTHLAMNSPLAQEQVAKTVLVEAVASGRDSLPSQQQKNVTEKVCSDSYEKHKVDIESYHVPKGLYMTTCYDDLLAIAYHESRFDNNAVGDHGLSHGPFQIYQKVHPNITLEQATDYRWAATWTLERMHGFGYPAQRTLSIKAHNGFNGNGMYEHDVKATSDRFLAMGL